MLKSLVSNRLLTLILIVALVGASLVFRLNTDINHDIAWYFYMAEGMLRGERLYSDFMEINPPLAAWQFWGVAWLSHQIGANLNGTFIVLMGALILGSMAWIASLQDRMNQSAPMERNIQLVLMAAAFTYLPGFDFGQREHIMTLMFMPWLFLRLARTERVAISAPEAIAAGAIAAFGLCLKPMAILAPVLVEIMLLLRFGKWRNTFAVENLAAAAGCAAYVAAVKIATPEYFTTMVELGVKAYVPFIGFDAATIFAGSLRVLLVAAVAGLFLRVAGALRSTHVMLFAAAATGFLVSYYVQAKGFGYQLLPAVYCTIFASFAALSENRSGGRLSLVARAVVPAILVFASVPEQAYQDRSDGIEARLKELRPDTKSYFIAAGTLPRAWPMVYKAGYEWGSRFPAQWAIPYVSTKWSGGPLPDDPIVRNILQWTIDDLLRHKPDVLLIDRDRDQAYVPGGWFDYQAFWARDPRFAAFFANYQLKDRISTFDIYIRN